MDLQFFFQLSKINFLHRFENKSFDELNWDDQYHLHGLLEKGGFESKQELEDDTKIDKEMDRDWDNYVERDTEDNTNYEPAQHNEAKANEVDLETYMEPFAEQSLIDSGKAYDYNKHGSFDENFEQWKSYVLSQGVVATDEELKAFLSKFKPDTSLMISTPFSMPLLGQCPLQEATHAILRFLLFGYV